MIQFTLDQAWSVILAVCGGIVTISAAVSVAIKIYNHLRRPNLQQDEEITKLWEEVNAVKGEQRKMENEFRSFFANDKKRLDAIETGNRVTQQALLALLSHGIDGNDIETMKKAKHDLENYLIAK